MNVTDLVNSTNTDGLDPDSSDVKELLADVQGNILEHHGRGFALHVPVRFKSGTQCVGGALDWIASEFRPTSALEQRENDGNRDFVFRMIGLSKSGYDALAIGEAHQPADPAFHKDVMRHWDRRPVGGGYGPRASGLEPYMRDRIDALIILAHDDSTRLDEEWCRLQEATAPFADIVINPELKAEQPEPGHLLWMSKEKSGEFGIGRKPEGNTSWYVECFGYADGISQPKFFRTGERGTEPNGTGVPLSLVLTEDRPNRFGSHLAFQKYEQDVDGFHRAIESLGDAMVIDDLAEKFAADPDQFVNGQGGDDLAVALGCFCDGALKCAPARRETCEDPRCADGVSCGDYLDHLKQRPDFASLMRRTRQFEELRPAIDLDRLYALAVGRYRDGTPLIDEGAGQFATGFDFDGDSDGLVCPFHAHVRRMNPRGELDRIRRDGDTRYTGDDAPDIGTYQIARRGVPYEQDYARGTVRGLYFLSFQSDLKNFELLLDAANDSHFVQQGYDKANWDSPPVGMDPILGEHLAPANQTWPRSDGRGITRHGFGQYVTLRGGGYFYAPSIEYLKTIRDAARPS